MICFDDMQKQVLRIVNGFRSLSASTIAFVRPFQANLPSTFVHVFSRCRGQLLAGGDLGTDASAEDDVVPISAISDGKVVKKDRLSQRINAKRIQFDDWITNRRSTSGLSPLDSSANFSEVFTDLSLTAVTSFRCFSPLLFKNSSNDFKCTSMTNQTQSPLGNAPPSYLNPRNMQTTFPDVFLEILQDKNRLEDSRKKLVACARAVRVGASV